MIVNERPLYLQEQHDSAMEQIEESVRNLRSLLKELQTENGYNPAAFAGNLQRISRECTGLFASAEILRLDVLQNTD
jgi:hypothetical protein